MLNDPNAAEPAPQPRRSAGESGGPPPGAAGEASQREDSSGISSTHLENLEEPGAAKAFAELIVDTVRDALLVLNLDLRVQAANKAFYNTFEVTPEETIGREVYALGNGQWDIPDLRELLERILPENAVMENYEVEHDFETIGRRVMLLNARQVNHHGFILLAIEDISEWRLRERELEESRFRFDLLVQNATEYAIFVMNPDTRISSWNPGAERILGWTEEEAIGQKGEIIFTPEDREAGRDREELETATEHGMALDEHWHVRKGGERFWASGFMVALRTEDELRGWAKILRDNTEKKQAQDALRQANEELEARVEKRTRQVRELASTLTMAEQEERRRISQILHDDLQQMLFAARLKLDVVRQAHLAGEDQTMLEALSAATERLKKTGEITRTLTVDLSPPILRSEGLTDALEWLQVQMRELHGLEVEIVAEESFRTPEEDMRVLLFQIVRELLFNVTKHAETDRARVTLRRLDHHVEITVADEGAGFDAETAAAETDRDGFGLFSIRERLGLFGGRMQVESAPGEGTRVVMDVPLHLE